MGIYYAALVLVFSLYRWALCVLLNWQGADDDANDSDGSMTGPPGLGISLGSVREVTYLGRSYDRHYDHYILPTPTRVVEPLCG